MRFQSTDLNAFSARRTLLVNSLQEFIGRYSEAIDPYERDGLLCLQRRLLRRDTENYMVLGTARSSDAPRSFRGKDLARPEFGGVETDLFAHQRNLIYHCLESEEFGVLQALGFRRFPEEMKVSSEAQVSALNGQYFMQDELMAGITELFLHEFSTGVDHVVLAAGATNPFGNRVRLFAEPVDRVQRELFRHSIDAGASVRCCLAEECNIFRLDEPWSLDFRYDRYMSFGAYMPEDPRLVSSTRWRVTHYQVDTTFDSVVRLTVRPSSNATTLVVASGNSSGDLYSSTRRLTRTIAASSLLDSDQQLSDFDVLYSTSSSNDSSDEEVDGVHVVTNATTVDESRSALQPMSTPSSPTSRVTRLGRYVQVAVGLGGSGHGSSSSSSSLCCVCECPNDGIRTKWRRRQRRRRCERRDPSGDDEEDDSNDNEEDAGDDDASDDDDGDEDEVVVGGDETDEEEEAATGRNEQRRRRKRRTDADWGRFDESEEDEREEVAASRRRSSLYDVGTDATNDVDGANDDQTSLNEAFQVLGRGGRARVLSNFPYMVELSATGNLVYVSPDGGRGRSSSPRGRSSPIRIRELCQYLLPRGYVNTVLLNNPCSGRSTAILSLCMFDDSRNNWIFARQLLFQRWFDIVARFPRCRYHCVFNADGLRDFVANFQHYSSECNVVLIDSSLARLRRMFGRAKAYRAFYCDQRYRRRPTPYGSFNYLVATRARNDWFSGSLYTTHTNVFTHTFCIERMYELPPIRELPVRLRLPFRGLATSRHFRRRCCCRRPSTAERESTFSVVGHLSSVFYNPNVSTVTGDAVLRQILHREYELLRLYAEDDSRRRSVLGNVAHLRERMLYSPCIICLSRDHDYFVTLCCRNPVCLPCSESVANTSCPACRQPQFSLVCFMLPNEEVKADSVLFRDYLSKTHVLVHHLQQLHEEYVSVAATSSSPPLPPKVLVVNYESEVRFNISRRLGNQYAIYSLKVTDLMTPARFLRDQRPVVLFCPAKQLLTGMDFHRVTHLFVLNTISCRDLIYLLSRVQRFPRDQPLTLRPFLSGNQLPLLQKLLKRGPHRCPSYLRTSLLDPVEDEVTIDTDDPRFDQLG